MASVLRLDRSVTLVVDRLQRMFGNGSGPRVLPILMYHSISAREERKADYYKLCTRPSVFREHLSVLSRLGCRGVDIESGLAWLHGPDDGVPRVAITFDDGFRDFHTEATPLLAEHQFTATMFLPSAFIGDERRRFAGIDCLTWNEVRECGRWGMRFGSHSVSHSVLHKLPWEEVRRELISSREQIEAEIGCEVTTFSYPYAFPKLDRVFREKFRELLVETGYTRCLTTIVGRVSADADALVLKRIPTNDADDALLLRAKLAGAYDWMEALQVVVKQLKTSVQPRTSVPL